MKDQQDKRHHVAYIRRDGRRGVGQQRFPIGGGTSNLNVMGFSTDDGGSGEEGKEPERSERDHLSSEQY